MEVTNLDVAGRRRAGLSYVPADRRGVGSVTQMTIADNAILGAEHRRFFRDIQADRETTEALVARFHVRASRVDAPAGKLSGGNLQKLILGREIMRGSKALIIEHPTRGLDVGAIESVREELLRARAAGQAILVISAELDELLNLADRVAVIFEGRIMDVFGPGTASLEQIGALMAGILPRAASPSTSTDGAQFGEGL
jgi:simple sugar transport system ATP-binding protein